MTKFNEADHPRVATGQFTDKPQSAPEVVLGDLTAVDTGIAAEVGSEVDALLPDGHRYKGDLARLTAITRSVFSEGAIRLVPRDRAAAKVAQIIGVADRRGIHANIPGDDVWPSQLDELDPPVPALWSLGDTSLLTETDDLVFIGGMRSCSAKGDSDAKTAAAALVAAGKTVVTTGQYGISGAAVRGTLEAGGRPIVVSCTGLDRTYPAGHDRLFEQVHQAGGLMLSVDAPTSSPTGYRMMRQAQVATELAGTAVVVEAGIRSRTVGTLEARPRTARPLRVLTIDQPETAEGSLGAKALAKSVATTPVSDPSTIASFLEKP